MMWPPMIHIAIPVACKAKYKTSEFQGGERKFGNFKEGENDKGGGNAPALNVPMITIVINSEHHK